jgi:hypothetical protein
MAKKSAFTTVVDRPDRSATVIRDRSKYGKEFAGNRAKYGAIYDDQTKEMYPEPGSDPFTGANRASSKKRVTESLSADRVVKGIRDKYGK